MHDGPVGARPTLTIDTVGQDMHELGRIVPNCALRRTAFEAAQTHDNIRLITGATVTQVVRHAQCAQVHYQVHEGGVRVDAPPLSAPLVVAADSRFSAVRRMLGVAAQMTDFGRGVIVCRMRHTLEHHDVAHECFGYERTLAILPLQPDPATGDLLCSAVVTSDSPDIARLMQLDEADFSAQVQARFQHRLGEMELVGPRHHYPLVATYARQFSGPRFALLGDAAVGMLPVTAHGFNLGLSGVEALKQRRRQCLPCGPGLGARKCAGRLQPQPAPACLAAVSGHQRRGQAVYRCAPGPQAAAPNRAAGGAALATAEGGHRGAIEWPQPVGDFARAAAPATVCPPGII